MQEVKYAVLSFSVFAQTGHLLWELAALCSVLSPSPHTQLRGHSLFDHGFSPWWQKGNVRSKMYYTILFCLCRDWPFALRNCCSGFHTVSISTYSAAWSLPFWSWVLTLMAKRKCEKQNVLYCPFLSLQRLASLIENLLRCVLYCLSALILNCVVTPWFLLAAFPLAVIYYLLQRFFRSSSR